MRKLKMLHSENIQNETTKIKKNFSIWSVYGKSFDMKDIMTVVKTDVKNSLLK